MKPTSGHEAVIASRERFLECLREALDHIHDLDHLRLNPLIPLMQLTNPYDAATRLHHMLVAGIDSMKPADDVPNHSRSWRLYEALHYMFVQQISQPVVADQLGLSIRHLRREQSAAIEILADILYKQINLEPQSAELPAQAPEQAAHSWEGNDFDWVRDISLEKPTRLEDALPEVLSLVQPLLDHHRVKLVFAGLEQPPGLAVHPVAINQILLSLLTACAIRYPGKTLTLTGAEEDGKLILRLQVPTASPLSAAHQAESEANLNNARQIIELSGGSLQTDGAHFIALHLPLFERIPILVIDDIPDMLQLMQRYTAGTRYRTITASKPEEIFPLIEANQPRVVLLDVMMPKVDGWKILLQLKHHPATQSVPVIICTILAQERLALSLGADGFLQKPITRDSLIRALNQLVDSAQPPRDTEPC